MTVGLLRRVCAGETPDEAGYLLRGNSLMPWRAKDAVGTAKTLHCSVDYLLGLTEDLNPAAAELGQTSLAMWIPGGVSPGDPCDVVADFVVGEDVRGRKAIVRKVCQWNGSSFLFREGGAEIDAEVVRWLTLPPVENEEKEK